MPLIWLVRFLLSLFSLVVWGGAAYLLWTWWDGAAVQDLDGIVHHVREDWRLWTGLVLLAWSLIGRLPARLLLAHPDTKTAQASRGQGETIVSPTGAHLHVEQYGKATAPTLILVHGWGLDSTIWKDTTDALLAEFRLVVWDLPGLGKSTAGLAEPSLEGFATDLASLIEAVGGSDVILVGHSIGGMTIQTLNRDHPDVVATYVSGIVLLNTTHTNPLRTMVLNRQMTALQPLVLLVMRLTALLEPLAWLGAWQSYLNGSAHMANRLGFGPDVTRRHLEHTTLLQTRNSPKSQAKGNIAMISWDATASLTEFSVPVLVVGGELDIVTKVEASRTIASLIPDAAITEVRGVNHMGFLERADVYNETIRQFARSMAARSGPTAP